MNLLRFVTLLLFLILAIGCDYDGTLDPAVQPGWPPTAHWGAAVDSETEEIPTEIGFPETQEAFSGEGLPGVAGIGEEDRIVPRRRYTLACLLVSWLPAEPRTGLQ